MAVAGLGRPLGLDRKVATGGSNIGDIVTRLAPPAGQFLPADGRKMPKAANSKLYTAIGDAYTIADFTGGMTSVTLSAAVDWSGLAYGNSVFVAVSRSTVGSISTDGGKTWSAITLPFACNALTFGAGLFVALPYGSSGNSCALSTDGVTWTLQTLPSTGVWGAICFGGDTFVAMGTGFTATSKDGKAWASGGSPGSSSAWSSIVFGNDIFVAVASNSTGTARSGDKGATWVGGATGLSQTPSAVGFINGVFVISCTTGTQTVVSSSGLTWFLSSSGQTEPNSMAIVSGAGVIFMSRYAASTTSNYFSYDGFEWTVISSPALGGVRTAAAFGSGAFITLGQNTASANRIDVFQTTNFNLPNVKPGDGLRTAYIKVA